MLSQNWGSQNGLDNNRDANGEVAPINNACGEQVTSYMNTILEPIFSSEDLYSVMDHDSEDTAMSALTEVESECTWAPDGFLSAVNSPHNSLDDSEPGKSFHLAVVKEEHETSFAKDTSLSPESGVSSMSQSSGNLSEYNSSPAAGVTANDSSQVKVRKPRGRKPKAVKEAEAAAASTRYVNATIPQTQSQSAGPSVFGNFHQPYNNHNNSRLDQLVSSRLSNLGGPKKSVVKPAFIQANIGLYTRLTTPRKQPEFDCQKLTQEKWIQYPNPSLPNQNNVGPPDRHMYANVSMGMGMGKIEKNMDPQANCLPTTNNHFTNDIGMNGMGQGDGYNNRIGSGNTGQCGGAYGFNAPGCQQQCTSSMNMNMRYNNPYYAINEVESLKAQLEYAHQVTYELKARFHTVTKINRNLMSRLRKVSEQNEILKISFQYNQRLPTVDEEKDGKSTGGDAK